MKSDTQQQILSELKPFLHSIGFECEEDQRGIKFWKQFDEGEISSFVQIYTSGEYDITSLNIFINNIEYVLMELFKKYDVTVESSVRYQNLDINRQIGALKIDRGIPEVFDKYKTVFNDQLYDTAVKLLSITYTRDLLLAGKSRKDHIEVSGAGVPKVLRTLLIHKLCGNQVAYQTFLDRISKNSNLFKASPDNYPHLFSDGLSLLEEVEPLPTTGI